MLRLRDSFEVFGRRRVDVDRLGCLGPNRDLVHIQGRAWKEHRPALGHGDDGDRVRHSQRRESRPLEGIDCDIVLRPDAVADCLAVEEHRGLVLLALADHDDATHRDRVEHEPHGVDRGLVGRDLVAASDPPRRERGGRLRDADELERQVPAEHLAHVGRSYIRSGASTPTRSRQRAMTDCTARTSSSRNTCCSDSSTRCWW